MMGIKSENETFRVKVSLQAQALFGCESTNNNSKKIAFLKNPRSNEFATDLSYSLKIFELE